MFSNLSSSSISLATVTPSLVERGAPKDLSRMTLRPLGPSVILTALARISTPRIIRSRASAENLASFAAISLFSVCPTPHPEERAKPASRRVSFEYEGWSHPSGRALMGAPQDEDAVQPRMPMMSDYALRYV